MKRQLAPDFSEFLKLLDENEVEYLKVNIINLEDLRKNKAASGRPKDLNDLERLPA